MDYLTLFSKGESFQSELIITKGHIQSDPFFSIFIPTFNRPDLLKKAIYSAISQDFKNNYEIVVIDNCSEYNSFIQIKEYINGLNLENNVKISLYRCISHSNSWNMGILKSISDWVIMLHDDDLLNYNHLSEVYKYISSKSEIIVLCSDSYNLIQTTQLSILNKFFMFFKENIKKFRRNRFVKLREIDFYFHNPASNTGVVLNRKVALEQGGFNFYKDSPIPDYAFFYRLTRDFDQTYYLNKKLSYIRFAVNDGLRKEVIQNVREKNDEIRKDILLNNSYLKSKDYRFREFILYLNKMEQSHNLSNLEKYIKIPFFKTYTRIISLIVYYKSLSS